MALPELAGGFIILLSFAIWIHITRRPQIRLHIILLSQPPADNVSSLDFNGAVTCKVPSKDFPGPGSRQGPGRFSFRPREGWDSARRC